MTDTTTQPMESNGSKFAKLTATAMYADFCNNITPVIVGQLCKAYPIIPENIYYQSTVAGLALFGAFIGWFSWKHIVQAIVSCVIFLRVSVQQIRDAIKNPLPPTGD